VKIQETRIKIQEVSEELQMGGILFPKYRDKLFEDEDLKRWKIGDCARKKDKKRLGHGKMSRA